MYIVKGDHSEMYVVLRQLSYVKCCLYATAGKISRRVSLIHYPEPGELKKRNSLKLSQSQRSSMATSTLSGRPLATPTRSIKPKNSHTTNVQAASTPSGITKSTTTQDSAKGNSVVTSTGSMEHSEERKPKKKRKTERSWTIYTLVYLHRLQNFECIIDFVEYGGCYWRSANSQVSFHISNLPQRVASYKKNGETTYLHDWDKGKSEIHIVSLKVHHFICLVSLDLLVFGKPMTSFMFVFLSFWFSMLNLSHSMLCLFYFDNRGWLMCVVLHQHF